jgi:hypothetical protein
MAEVVALGEITCPSGELVLMDGGYLGLWSGSRSPDEVQQPDAVPAVDLEVVGLDADAAARSFNRQSGRTLYDIPEHGRDQFIELFGRHCRDHALSASLRAFDRRVPHRDRVRRAIVEGDPDFLVEGVAVVAVGGLPTDRPLPVTAAVDDEWGWAYIRIQFSAEPCAGIRRLGSVGVDCARFVFGDAGALNAWIHEEPVDGLADVVFWGRDEAAVADHFAASRTGTPGEENYGWLNLPVREAYAKAVALDDWRNRIRKHTFAYDLRPHSHHWRVMADVRAAEHDAATIEVGGARLMFAMTSVGDGFFPVHVEQDASGAPTAIQLTIQADDEPDG